MRLAFFAALFIGLVVVVRLVPIVRILEQVADWMDEIGPWAPIVFVGVYVVAGSLFVPDTLLRLAAGVFLGLFWGVVVASIGLTIVAAIGFLIGRHFARDLVKKRLK